MKITKEELKELIKSQILEEEDAFRSSPKQRKSRASFLNDENYLLYEAINSL